MSICFLNDVSIEVSIILLLWVFSTRYSIFVFIDTYSDNSMNVLHFHSRGCPGHAVLLVVAQSCVVGKVNPIQEHIQMRS